MAGRWDIVRQAGGALLLLGGLMSTEVTALGLPSAPILENKTLTFPEQPYLTFP